MCGVDKVQMTPEIMEIDVLLQLAIDKLNKAAIDFTSMMGRFLLRNKYQKQ